MLGPMYNNNNIWPYILRIHNAATSKHPRSFDEIEDEWIYSWRRPIYDVKQDWRRTTVLIYQWLIYRLVLVIYDTAKSKLASMNAWLSACLLRGLRQGCIHQDR